MSQAFNQDFSRAIDVEQNRQRAVLQKKAEAISKLFKAGKKTGGSIHDIYLDKVEYQGASGTEVFQDSPTPQHPSISTRKDLGSHSKIMVGVPRKVAQTRGISTSGLASSYVGSIMAAKARRMETQVEELLSATYSLNPIMDGIDESSADDSAEFPTGNNYTGRFGGTGNRKLHFLDIMDARRILANARGDALTMSQYEKMPAMRTLDDINTIIFCDNDTWFAFIAQNRNTFFNSDFSKHWSAAFSVDGFKVNTLQDSAVITTSQAITRSSADTGFNVSSTAFPPNGGQAGTGAALGTGTWRPMYIMAKGAFEIRDPSADNFPLALKEIQNKSFESVFYGECNIFGKRIYDEQVIRYWVNVADTEPIA